MDTFSFYSMMTFVDFQKKYYFRVCFLYFFMFNNNTYIWYCVCWNFPTQVSKHRKIYQSNVRMFTTNTHAHLHIKQLERFSRVYIALANTIPPLKILSRIAKQFVNCVTSDDYRNQCHRSLESWSALFISIQMVGTKSLKRKEDINEATNPIIWRRNHWIISQYIHIICMWFGFIECMWIENSNVYKTETLSMKRKRERNKCHNKRVQNESFSFDLNEVSQLSKQIKSE